MPDLRAALDRGIKALRFPSTGSGTGYGATGSWLTGLFPLLPGTRYDYKREAGTLWLNGIVLTAVQWLCRTWSEAPAVVRRPGEGGALEPVIPHPLTDLLARPNAYYDASVLCMGTLLSWVVDGNAYWYIERGGADQPVGLVYLPHYLMSSVRDRPTVYRSGYLYRVDGKTVPLKLADVVHFQNGLDPANMMRGISPLAAELRSICTDNEAQSYAAALLRNMGVPGVVITPKDSTVEISPNSARHLKELWRAATTGDRRGEPIVPALPVEIQNPGFSPEQLALDKLAQASVPRICAAIGIDPMVLGLPSDQKTYANMAEAREKTYEQMLIPLQGIFDTQLTLQLAGQLPGWRPGDVLGRDYSNVRSLQDDMDKLYARQTRAVGGPWLTPNEARAKLGLKPLPGGEALYPAGAAPLAAEGLPQTRSRLPGLAGHWQQRRELAETAGLNGDGGQ